jgi:hypothetical protein
MRDCTTSHEVSQLIPWRCAGLTSAAASRVGRGPRVRFSAGAFIGVSALLALATLGCKDGGNAPVAETVGADLKVVTCDQIVGHGRPLAGERVISGQVVLPPERVPEEPRFQPKYNKPLPWFAKQGLLVRRGSKPVDLIVPLAWRSRFAVGWGNEGRQQAPAVRIVGCNTGPKWHAYAGGYYLRQPACVPLTVRVEGQTTQIRLGIGRSCG